MDGSAKPAAPEDSGNETPREATATFLEQSRVERLVAQSYATTARIVASLDGAAPGGPVPAASADSFAFAESVPLTREEHVAYCRAGLENLPAQMSSLDASRPWLCYWMTHSLELLGSPVDAQCAARLVDFLGTRCQDPDGGFAGGPGQLAHLAPTYAAVNTLVTLGTPEAYACVRRPELYAFLLRLKNEDGSFSVHEGGESDVRGTYTAVSVATQTGIASSELFSGTAEWLASCQTYEGGMGGEPGNEAHGGYTFCGVAALALLGQVAMLDQPCLLRWLAARQLPHEGGFQGRTQKVRLYMASPTDSCLPLEAWCALAQLVDSCYSFWQASVPSLVAASLGAGGTADSATEWYNRKRLQQWLLCCCQDQRGGLKDKPVRQHLENLPLRCHADSVCT